jgi:hypothetical protein
VATDFASAVRSDEIWGAVAERDADTVYFYLLDLTRPDGQRIVGALNVTQALSAREDFDVKWSPAGGIVGFFANDLLVAVHEIDDVKGAGRFANASDRALFT